MANFKQLQKEVYQNKINHGFNVIDINLEFCSTYEELADVVIFLMGISEILGIDLEEEIENKIKKNAKRKYKTINGVLMKVDG